MRYNDIAVGALMPHAWYLAIKHHEATLVALGFSASDAWRLAFGER